MERGPPCIVRLIYFSLLINKGARDVNGTRRCSPMKRRSIILLIKCSCSVEFKPDLFKLEGCTISTAFTSFGSSESSDWRRDNWSAVVILQFDYDLVKKLTFLSSWMDRHSRHWLTLTLRMKCYRWLGRVSMVSRVVSVTWINATIHLCRKWRETV